jgi:propanol-preferring alcohol dehydrogenase
MQAMEAEMSGDAIEQALAGGNLECAALLIEQEWEGWFWRGERRTVERWLQALPAALVRARPVLPVAGAAVYAAQLQIGRAEQALVVACLEREGCLASRDLRGKVQTLFGFTARMSGDKEQALARLRQAATLLDADNQVWRSVALYNLGLAHADRRELKRAAAALAGAAAAAQEANCQPAPLAAGDAWGHLWEGPEALQKTARLYQAALPPPSRFPSGEVEAIDLARRQVTIRSGAWEPCAGRPPSVVRELGQPLAIEEVPVPQPGPGQVLVKIRACGVCHIDARKYRPIVG